MKKLTSWIRRVHKHVTIHLPSFKPLIKEHHNVTSITSILSSIKPFKDLNAQFNLHNFGWLHDKTSIYLPDNQYVQKTSIECEFDQTEHKNWKNMLKDFENWLKGQEPV